jgi:mannosyltransferase OCH1-like enzyme
MESPNKIPRIIHYCWFGRKEKPEIVRKCIKSWKEALKGYKFIEWNEDTFDINSNLYVQQAYKAGKYAFVSDYVRVYALYHFGGIYLDTDVEVFKSFNDLLHHESFWGFEQENYIATSTIGATEGNNLVKIFLDAYFNKSFIKEDGSYNELTNVAIVSKLLMNEGIKLDGSYQVLEGKGTFYPQQYFSPYDYINCATYKTKDTYAVHYFFKSWLPLKERYKSYIKKIISKIIGGNNIAKLRKLVRN